MNLITFDCRLGPLEILERLKMAMKGLAELIDCYDEHTIHLQERGDVEWGRSPGYHLYHAINVAGILTAGCKVIMLSFHSISRIILSASFLFVNTCR